MSQKAGKKTRRRTEEELESTGNETKNVDSRAALENGKSNDNSLNEEVQEIQAETNDKIEVPEKRRLIETRSRSSTPIMKKVKPTEPQTESLQESGNSNVTEEKKNGSGDALNSSLDSVQEEEIESESQTHENSELQLKLDDSPILRSKVNKSVVTSHIPSETQSSETEQKQTENRQPYVSLVRMENLDNKKDNDSSNLQDSVESNDSTKKPEENITNGHEESNDSFASLATNDLSTVAVCESDATRLNAEFSLKDSEILDSPSNSFLNITKDKSLVDTCRRLSSRKSIRPLDEDFRKRVLRSNLENKDSLDSPYPSRYSVERITGMKRKNHSITPPDTKRARTEGGTIMSYISRPISTLKRRISRSDLQSNTPKLTGYKTRYEGFEINSGSQVGVEVGRSDMEKKWCSIM
ncbi:uncharacterized protein DDB_G0286299-like isoform X2 [Agrilus planipennis]|nr:uncharacterized protein DDB_G0286299-like isoform X2 [Agrilus planipennis]XP_025832372.1 uncharacterized protein DDB_G0286299-like isoform X2 [Agrilus planipennis]